MVGGQTVLKEVCLSLHTCDLHSLAHTADFAQVVFVCVRSCASVCVFTPSLPVCLYNERSGRRVVDGGKRGGDDSGRGRG